MFKLKVLSRVIATSVATSLLIGCGGGGSSSSSSGTTSTSITGSAFASYVAGARIEIEDLSGNLVAGPVTTNATGRYVMDVPNASLGGDLVVVANGGLYKDEATGAAGVRSDRLAVFVPANSMKANSTFNATPATTILAQLAERLNNLEMAKQYFETAFGFLPDASVVPVDATQEQDEATDEAAKIAGMRAAAFSQLLLQRGLQASHHTALLEAIAEDLEDGVADGMNAGSPVLLNGVELKSDIANQFAMALMSFANDAAKNKSGLTLGQVGLVKFNPKARSENYRFELEAEGMSQMGQGQVGHSVFTLEVEDADGNPVVGETPVMTPKMYMAAGHIHSTPNTGCSVTNAKGVAKCTAYFLMPSAMSTGDVMGNWELKFELGSDKVYFFPKVTMAMGDTARAVLKGVDDKIPMMGGMTAARNYNLFNNGLSGEGNSRSIELFVSAQESMMSFPALIEGETLNAGTDYELTTDTIVVEVSTDNTPWIEATTNNDGLWTASGLTGLMDGEEATLYVKLSVKGEPKTTSGSSDGDTSAQFKVTPGSNAMNMTM